MEAWEISPKQTPSLHFGLSSYSRKQTRKGIHTITGEKHLGYECFIASKMEEEHSAIEDKIKNETELSRNFQPQREFKSLSISNSYPKS